VVAAVRRTECVGQVVVIQVLLPPHQLVDKQDIMAVVLKKEVAVVLLATSAASIIVAPLRESRSVKRVV
jgi:hypothetical protein